MDKREDPIAKRPRPRLGMLNNDDCAMLDNDSGTTFLRISVHVRHLFLLERTDHAISHDPCLCIHVMDTI